MILTIHHSMMRILYYFFLLLGIAFLLYWGYFKKEGIQALLVFFLLYRPAIDYVFIRKMKLYEGKRLWLKYPFWGFSNRLLWG